MRPRMGHSRDLGLRQEMKKGLNGMLKVLLLLLMLLLVSSRKRRRYWWLSLLVFVVAAAWFCNPRAAATSTVPSTHNALALERRPEPCRPLPQPLPALGALQPLRPLVHRPQKVPVDRGASPAVGVPIQRQARLLAQVAGERSWNL